jgi:hypothetical protein
LYHSAADCDDGYAWVAGYDIHYQDSGPYDATPVLLAHGFGAWSFTWRAQRQALLQVSYRVITTDQIGYGAPVYTTLFQAELIHGVLDALDVASAHWAGHSYGTRLAMQAELIGLARARSSRWRSRHRRRAPAGEAVAERDAPVIRGCGSHAARGARGRGDGGDTGLPTGRRRTNDQRRTD